MRDPHRHQALLPRSGRLNRELGLAPGEIALSRADEDLQFNLRMLRSESGKGGRQPVGRKLGREREAHATCDSAAPFTSPSGDGDRRTFHRFGARHDILSVRRE